MTAYRLVLRFGGKREKVKGKREKGKGFFIEMPNGREDSIRHIPE